MDGQNNRCCRYLSKTVLPHHDHFCESQIATRRDGLVRNPRRALALSRCIRAKLAPAAVFYLEPVWSGLD